MSQDHTNQVINSADKNAYCKTHGSGRYTTDWIMQLKADQTIHQKTAQQRVELKQRQRH